jgi:hypothetical protein
METQILETINDVVREEKGKRVDINSTLRDAELDSFGITMLFIQLDDKYQYFTKAGLGDDPFSNIEYDTITIAEIVTTCMLETTATE